MRAHDWCHALLWPYLGGQGGYACAGLLWLVGPGLGGLGWLVCLSWSFFLFMVHKFMTQHFLMKSLIFASFDAKLCALKTLPLNFKTLTTFLLKILVIIKNVL